ncbi:methanophenazine hydrogenase cytochrome b subunit [Methanosarcina mazei]|uniref:Cytochrome B n=4 Tax=Methanosarcina mazei TaxID=2209 RepID=A0A0F8JC72_METMZ|nr:methanophenazine hydrogenase cytochrome b subunit [Methanosarcina mazei]AGF97555.1 Methanophenazine hydrogenase cytochrome b subunit [Methanosarcina mazei Tuc01]AKB41456.1 Methanophenazine hydrogenase cytochrome b subunit [Methanosarcina mazei WWM610]AKB65708.1 Methanophenazine hydrogenase cytochrome b subunit [Methanosarcina mazei S-6]KKG74922.1 cytochrome B [Methanosarcina mazei]KKG87424.1 cytochrome B [Methanosarcina mazei]
MVRSAEKPASRRLVVERYTWLERVTHLVHLISMFVLLITGFKIYTGWGFMSFESARALHMIAVPFFLVANWLLVPYNIFSCKEEHCSIGDRLYHFKESYLFGKDDAERLLDIIKNFFGKGEYPAFTVYDERKGHYVTKLHPGMKLLLIFESTAIVLVALTGIVLYSLTWSPFGIPVPEWILSISWFFASMINMDGLALIRYLHLLAAYWFVLELIIHVGILELDPDAWKYHKAIFWSGNEDLSDRHFVKVIEEKDQVGTLADQKRLLEEQ